MCKYAKALHSLGMYHMGLDWTNYLQWSVIGEQIKAKQSIKMCKLFHNKSFFDVNTIGWHSFGLFAHGWPIKTTNNVILSRIKICESINTKTVFWVPSPCVYKQFSFNPYKLCSEIYWHFTFEIIWNFSINVNIYRICSLRNRLKIYRLCCIRGMINLMHMWTWQTKQEANNTGNTVCS